MILSFHPMITADRNIICAGRDPGQKDLTAIRQADAVILPQGCRKTLCKMAITHCPHVFPDYRARFEFPGKIGQSQLFTSLDLPYPYTEFFVSIEDFLNKTEYPNQTSKFDFPFVFKFDWGGEGNTVFYVDSPAEFEKIIEKTASFERTGHCGFLIQQLIPTDGRSLRVVVIGQKRIAYWRVPTCQDRFGTALSGGAEIDRDSDPDMQADGINIVDRLCHKTGINLAGVDLIFPAYSKNSSPLFLEINYFFGRTGIGGSDRFYAILESEVQKWLQKIRK